MPGDPLPAPFNLRLGGKDAPSGPPDPLSEPEYYEGVLGRRVWGWVIDICVYFALWLGVGLVVVLINIATLWLLSPIGLLVLAVLPMLYHSLTISGASRATVGMRIMGLEVRTLDGRSPDFVRAAIHWILFHLSVGFTGGLILIFPFFNTRRRTFHDFLTDLIVLRRL